MKNRPIVSFGAAFLLTVVAALFAPVVLPFAALPLVIAVVVTRLRSRQVIALAAGCLAAVLCCGVFWLRGGDVAVPEESDEPTLRDQLAAATLANNPAPATGVTLAIVLGYRDAVPASVREALQRSGMSHLMSVSGLHISIAAAGAAAIAKRLRLRRMLQFGAMTATVLVFWLASGMTVSATRAVIMVLLGLGAELLGRRADGLTSLSLAAVLLVGPNPMLVTDLSFRLSFLAVLGILLLSTPLTRLFETIWQAAFGDKRPVPRGIFAAIATSLAAQLAVTPIVGWIFGSVPLLGVFTNLVAIPLVYPVMLLGLLSMAATMGGLSGLANILLTVANLFSQLLTWLAQLAAALPFCSFDTLFPVDFAAVGLLAAALLLLFLPTRLRLRLSLSAGVAVLGCIAAAVSIFSAANTISVTASANSGTLLIAAPTGTVVVDNATSTYRRRRDRELLERMAQGDVPVKLLATYPYRTDKQLQDSVRFYGVDGYQPLTDTPTELLDGVTVRRVAPYCTEIIIGATKLMKYDAEYDTIMEYGGSVPDTGAVLADMAGNLLDRTGKVTIVRRPDGTSCLRIPT